MTFSVLISTIDDKLHNISLPALPDTEYVIVHQLTQQNAKQIETPKSLQRDDVKIYQYRGKGLAESRNKALELATGDICIISDDDVTFEDKAISFVNQAFHDHPNADIITFQARFESGKPFKAYKDRSFRHNWRSIWNVSSIEIALKRQAIVESCVEFDTRFGLGSAFPTGEEYLFLQDALSKGLTLIYYPATIGVHHEISSGHHINEELLKAKGAMIKRAYPYLYPFLNCAFAMRKFSKQKNINTFFKYLAFMFKGSRSFKDNG